MQEALVEIRGNTYPLRKQLSAIGGTWVPESRAWLVPAGREAEVLDLLNQKPRTPPSRFDGMVPYPSAYSFEFKDELKEIKIGGKWNSDDRVWMVPEGQLFDAQCVEYEYNFWRNYNSEEPIFIVHPTKWRAFYAPGPLPMEPGWLGRSVVNMVGTEAVYMLDDREWKKPLSAAT
jgi:hypothetical protein